MHALCAIRFSAVMLIQTYVSQ